MAKPKKFVVGGLLNLGYGLATAGASANKMAVIGLQGAIKEVTTAFEEEDIDKVDKVFSSLVSGMIKNAPSDS
jgi:hypothetical protein